MSLDGIKIKKGDTISGAAVYFTNKKKFEEIYSKYYHVASWTITDMLIFSSNTNKNAKLIIRRLSGFKVDNCYADPRKEYRHSRLIVIQDKNGDFWGITREEANRGRALLIEKTFIIYDR